jgi:hypothetical protein
VSESKAALTAYVPVSATARTARKFELPLETYIIETVEREARRTVRLRQLGFALTLVAGIFVSQWPVAFSSANAVPSLPVSAQEAGARTATAGVPQRFDFAAGMQSSY